MCVSCRQEKPTSDLVCFRKILNPSSKKYFIVLSPNKYQHGRSAYICKLDACIQVALKGKKIQKMLRASSEETSKEISNFFQTLTERRCG